MFAHCHFLPEHWKLLQQVSHQWHLSLGLLCGSNGQIRTINSCLFCESQLVFRSLSFLSFEVPTLIFDLFVQQCILVHFTINSVLQYNKYQVLKLCSLLLFITFTLVFSLSIFDMSISIVSKSRPGLCIFI